MIRLSNNLLRQHIMAHPKLSGIERWVAIAIIHHRNELSFDCYPTHRRLAELTGIERRTLTAIIQRLRTKKIIVTIKKVNLENHHKNPLQYYFLFDFKTANAISKTPQWPGNADDIECVRIKLKNSLKNTPPLRAAAHIPFP